MLDGQREKRLKYAEQKIEKDSSVVCVCGATFLEPGPYADHVETCEHAERGVPAQGKADFERE